MKRSQRNQYYAKRHALIGACLGMLTGALAIFAFVAYQNESPFLLGVLVLTVIVTIIPTWIHISEFFRLDALATDEAMRELGIFRTSRRL